MCSSVHASPRPNKETTVSVCREGLKKKGIKRNKARPAKKQASKENNKKHRSKKAQGSKNRSTITPASRPHDTGRGAKRGKKKNSQVNEIHPRDPKEPEPERNRAYHSPLAETSPRLLASWALPAAADAKLEGSGVGIVRADSHRNRGGGRGVGGKNSKSRSRQNQTSQLMGK